MNKVYKVIWSKVRNCYMVVSELAKRNGKNTGTTDKRRKVTAGLALAAIALTLNLGTMGIAEAAVLQQVNASNNATDNGHSTALAGGPGASASSNYSLAVGYYTQANWESSIAVGNKATTGRLLTQTEAEVGAYYDWQQIIMPKSLRPTMPTIVLNLSSSICCVVLVGEVLRHLATRAFFVQCKTLLSPIFTATRRSISFIFAKTRATMTIPICAIAFARH